MKINNSFNNYYVNLKSIQDINKKMDTDAQEISEDKNITKNLVDEEILKDDFKANIVSIKTQDENNKTILDLKA